MIIKNNAYVKLKYKIIIIPVKRGYLYSSYLENFYRDINQKPVSINFDNFRIKLFLYLWYKNNAFNFDDEWNETNDQNLVLSYPVRLTLKLQLLYLYSTILKWIICWMTNNFILLRYTNFIKIKIYYVFYYNDK